MTLTYVTQDYSLEQHILLFANPEGGEHLANFARQIVEFWRDFVGLHHAGGHAQIFGVANVAIVGAGAEDQVEAEDLQPGMLQLVHLVHER